MKFEQKKNILKEIFEKTEKMNDAEKNYLIGYIQGFNDKKSLSTDKNDLSVIDKTR